MSSPSASHSAQSGLILAALGVVFGDIGTSPLYALKECLIHIGGQTPSPGQIFGILSLMFWSIMMVVSFKYLSAIMRADNKGEGGILALMALAQRGMPASSKRSKLIMIMGIFGAALFYGDSMITPAISVLSAFEGISIISHRLDAYIIPLTIGVLVALFLLQQRGTAVVGKLFGPIMVLWFATLATLGIISIAQTPAVLQALNPWHAVAFFAAHPFLAFTALGSVVLVVTGGEALYADMGHFGKSPIRKAWFLVALPALSLNYFGQGALLLRDAAAIKNPFFLLAPEWAMIPMVILAAAATVIASQAVISGAFSVTNQAVHLGYCPRMGVHHTSEHEMGQIYVPQINWFLLVAVVLLVISFKSSSNLASAYGFSVCATMVIETAIALTVLGRGVAGSLRWLVYGALATFLLVDVAFLSANMFKLLDGGWFPLLIGLVIFALMTTWKRGRSLLSDKLREGELPLKGFVESLEMAPPQRVEGIAIFMTGSSDSVPHALLHNLKHNKVLHEQVVFLTVQTADVPYVAREEQVAVKKLGKTFYQAVATYGFKDDVSVSEVQELITQQYPELEFDPMNTSYFLSRETIVEATRPALSWWQRHLFSVMSRNAMRATAYFGIPPNRVVEMGMQIEM
ncbi:KUP system potassium uptake protein [Formivibrio citricus]|uniref:Probable potassium transport system protein Kup n=1 Tax=Formivibrio citricus TaxID=83765 RepID=A0A1I4YP55_9NEIS|nr:potassium transporter Kup [Formivibrio citricus]SFN39791.1 KUP system potassium uptake protein [Formivibrio citricus]